MKQGKLRLTKRFAFTFIGRFHPALVKRFHEQRRARIRYGPERRDYRARAIALSKRDETIEPSAGIVSIENGFGGIAGGERHEIDVAELLALAPVGESVEGQLKSVAKQQKACA